MGLDLEYSEGQTPSEEEEPCYEILLDLRGLVFLFILVR
jgi:hypothetical protein